VNKLGFLARDPGKWGSVGSGDKHEIKSHVLAEFTQLIFDGAARVGALWILPREFQPGFERGILSGYAQKSAVAQIPLGVDIRDRDLAIAERRMQAITHRRLDEALNHPETGCQQYSEGQKAQDESAGAKMSFHRDPPLCPVSCDCCASCFESISRGMKKSAVASCALSTTIVLRKKPAVLCQATSVY
jgi:hypothetical protein